jgi:hypothetical protein
LVAHQHVLLSALAPPTIFAGLYNAKQKVYLPIVTNFDLVTFGGAGTIQEAQYQMRTKLLHLRVKI